MNARRPTVKEMQSARERILALTEPVFAGLGRLGAAFVHAGLERRDRPFDQEDAWDLMAPTVKDVVRGSSLVRGAGVAVDDGSGEAVSMAWWIRDEDEVLPKKHVTNPQSDSFYDVSHLRWFTEPMASGEASILGPYVDSWGTDDLTLTAAIPVDGTSQRLGVAAADLATERFIEAVDQVLGATWIDVLLDRDDRVIVARDPDLDTGTRMATIGRGVVRREAVEPHGWSLALLG
ncbi:cache domain-containing protein [Aeromicrobium sp. CTD01-1L150]|uniref:cache domain-containing protein n=1 Tax=Aeromicrobium sp. CTD01-1L150 TaxID=3341830 RepID=UPI0035C1EDD0